MNIFLLPYIARLIRKILRALGILSTPNQTMNTGLVLSQTMKNFIRCAGLSGTLALCLGVYGAHVMKDHTPADLRRLFQLAQTYHLVHSVALLAVPFVSRPKLTGLLFLGGLTFFCGPIYYHAICNDPQYRRITPYGGSLLIAGWLSIALL